MPRGWVQLKAALSIKKRFTPAEAQVQLGGESRVRRLASLGHIPDLSLPDCELLVPVVKKELRRLSTFPNRSQSTEPQDVGGASGPPVARSQSVNAGEFPVPVRQSMVGRLFEESLEKQRFVRKTIDVDLTENLVVRNRLARESGQRTLVRDWSLRAAQLLRIQNVEEPAGARPDVPARRKAR
jgi:hypothetical protein